MVNEGSFTPNQEDTKAKEKQELEAKFAEIEQEMDGILQKKVDEVEITENTTVPEIDKMIWAKLKELFDEYPDIRDKKNGKEDALKQQLTYALPSMVYTKASSILENDPKKQKFYEIVYNSHIDYNKGIDKKRFTGELKQNPGRKAAAQYQDVFLELGENSHEFQDLKKNLKSELEKLTNPDNELSKEQYDELMKRCRNLFDTFKSSFKYEEFLKNYPLTKHVGYKEDGRDNTTKLTNHVAGTATHFGFHNGIYEGILNANKNIPSYFEVYAFAKLRDPEIVNSVQELLDDISWEKSLRNISMMIDGELADGIKSFEGMPTDEIKQKLREKIEKFVKE